MTAKDADAIRFCDAVKDPSKVLNVHFFNPALVMKTVEVVKGPHTAKETFDAAFAFVKSIDKTPCTIEKEIYGFVVNRIFSVLTREACLATHYGKGEYGRKLGKGFYGYTK